MDVENQNSAGTTSALAQKTGIKPLSKIIAGVGAAIVALVALCTIFGNSDGISMLKDRAFNELDPTITFEEAVDRYCKKNSGSGSNYFANPEEFSKKAKKGTEYSECFDTFETSCGEEKNMPSVCVKDSFVITRKAVWEDSGETSTGVRNVFVKFVDEGEVWIDAEQFSTDARKKLAMQAEFFLDSVDFEKLFFFVREKAESGDDEAWKNLEKIEELIEGNRFVGSVALRVGYSNTEKWLSGTLEKIKEAEEGKLNVKELAWKVFIEGSSFMGEMPSEEQLAATKAQIEGIPEEVLTEGLKELRNEFDAARKSLQELRPVIEEVCAYLDFLKKRYFKVKGKKDVFTIGFYVYPDGRVETKQTEKLREIYEEMTKNR